MKLTVITVCYNSAKTIEQAIKSVVFQDYRDLEYIIIDGGSIDSTLEIIEKYRDYITVCISESDSGIYDAMNKGLKYASGDVVAFLNSDDWYAPNIQVFKKVEEYFSNGKADIISGNIYRYKGGTEKKMPWRRLTEETAFLGAICPHPAMFVKRELYSRLGGFDTSYQIAADAKWTLEAYLNGANILFVEDYFTCFREGGISTTKIYEAVKEEYKAMLSCARKYNRSQIENDITDYYIRKLKNLENESSMKTAFKKRPHEIKKLFDQNKEYYIWGAGARGKECLEIFEKLDVSVKGFIDMNIKKKSEKGYTIIKPEDIDKDSYICITPERYEEEIKISLKSMGIDENRFFTYSHLIKKIVEIGSL